jgi:hypothetical protein
MPAADQSLEQRRRALLDQAASGRLELSRAFHHPDRTLDPRTLLLRSLRQNPATWAGVSLGIGLVAARIVFPPRPKVILPDGSRKRLAFPRPIAKLAVVLWGLALPVLKDKAIELASNYLHNQDPNPRRPKARNPFPPRP